MLEEELAGSRKRCEVVLGLENEIINYKREIERLKHDREIDGNKVKDLMEENQRLQRELEAAKTDRNKIEKEAAYEFEIETKKVQTNISRLEEQARRDNHALMKAEQEVIETRREKENLQTVVDMLKQQNKIVQIEKDTDVEALSKQASSLNVRAAHTQNQQLELVRKENKKLISEKTVLQTHVTKASHEKERLAHNLPSIKSRNLKRKIRTWWLSRKSWL